MAEYPATVTVRLASGKTLSVQATDDEANAVVRLMGEWARSDVPGEMHDLVGRTLGSFDSGPEEDA